MFCFRPADTFLGHNPGLVTAQLTAQHFQITLTIMSSRDSSPEQNIFTKKKLKSSKPKPGQQDLEEAVPAHILRWGKYLGEK